MNDIEKALLKESLGDQEEIIGQSEDEGIYSSQEREELMDSDAISPAEAGFMEGYDEAYT